MHFDNPEFENAYLGLLRANKASNDRDSVLYDDLANLENLAHDREYGLKLVQQIPLAKLLGLLHYAGDTETRQKAARIIGSSLQNNPESLSTVRGTGLIRELLTILKDESNSAVKASLIFALSAAVAGNDEAKEFFDANGSQLLRDRFAKDGVEVQGKCATFVEDVLSRHRLISGVDEEISQWSRTFQDFLQSRPLDVTSEKVLAALMYGLSLALANCNRTLKREAGDVCQTQNNFIAWLADNVVAGGHGEVMDELLREARHKVFGNPKAARKAGWELEERPTKDEL